ncbi:MAG: hypothetical protein ABR585_12545 [Gemmatimonadaceae bacterium]|nr:hypothetical protein [Actinomycetota bacterium]
MTNTSDWNELKFGKIKRILMQEISVNEWFTDAYGNPDHAYTRLNTVLDKIMDEFRLYCNKLTDDVCKQHHEEHE